MSSLRLMIKLVVAQFRLHPGRALLTSAAVIASSCAVVWVVSGYDALVSQFDENAQKYLGRYDVVIAPIGPPTIAATIDGELIDALRQDPGVLEANPVVQSRATVTSAASEGLPPAEDALSLLVGSRPPVNGAPPIDPMLVGTDAAEPPYELVEGDWITKHDADSPPPAVLSRGAAARMGVTVGDETFVTTLANRVRVRIVGIVEQAPEAPSVGPPRGSGARRRDRPSPSKREGETPKRPPPQSDAGQSTVANHGPGMPISIGQTPAISAIYVGTSTAEQINGYPPRPNLVQLVLRDGVTPADFRATWEPRLAKASFPLMAMDFDSVRDGLETSGSVVGKKSQAYAATALAALAAVFIIFTTLSMGVSERSREFAMLRAIALTRSQVAGVIVVESVLLAAIGWLGGLAAGWGLLAVASRAKPDLFANGAALGSTCVWLTGLSVLGGALGAAVLPAWRTMRIQPLDAMTARPTQEGGRWTRLMLFIGLALVAAASLAVFLLPMSDEGRVRAYAFFSYPALLIGMALVAPAAVIACEKLFAPPLAMLLRLDPKLLRTQLTSNLWRTIGTALALSVGLALYASTQTWGYSMLQPFLPGKWLPDMLTAFHPIGLDDSGVEAIRKVDGVAPDQVLPLAVEQAKFKWSDEGAPGRVSQDNAVIFGLDPQRAMGGTAPLLNLRFVEGDRQEVAKRLAAGGACVISDDFQMSSGLKVGDELRFTPPNAPETTVAYKIVGVVSLPGWHWITKFSGVRRHFVRTAAIVFAAAADVRRDFRLERTEFYWMNLDGAAPLPKIEAQLQALAERNAGDKFRSEGYGEVTAYRPFARATATETVRKAIGLRADDVIWGMSQLPLITLAITSLAVANAVAASVRARTWELGVLRAVGATRGQLGRLVLAESLLIGIVACALSLAFGLIAGWCGVEMSRYGGGFFGGSPTFVVPWARLALGFAAALGLCLLAALWPAVKTGRAEPLALLQAGRASM